jgi:putative ABC transport system permease protein
MIFIPISTAQQFLAGNTSVSTISVQATDQKNMTDIQNQITSLLLERHNISDSTLADFSVLNQADIIASASSITNTLTLLLGAIAGISLIVGGIGIMNMMLTNVTERTREIGLRKSIGAKKTDISMQFLTEAAALTIIGGVIGIFIGWLASLGITQFGGIATKISPTSVFLAFGMAAGIGLLFGYYPARKASNLHPIDALRYE